MPKTLPLMFDQFVASRHHVPDIGAVIGADMGGDVPVPGENIEPGETTWDGLTELAIIDVSDENGAAIESDYAGGCLRSEYDPPTATLQSPAEILAALRQVPKTPEKKAALAELYLRHARDLLKDAGATRAVDRVRLAITSAGGAVRNARGKATR